MDQYIGKMLDNRYELLEVVGTGGMAVVYKAKCHRLNRYVAVKILKEEAAADPELLRRFRDESQAVAMLSHPNIVAVYDVNQSDNLEYIVMELIDGITLKQYMTQKGGSLPWKEALHFITQIMRALRHAHSRGIIHRDIKPQNVMVLRDGSAKVADFGIAHLSNSQNTTTQEALGSVHYISPEQAKGAKVDARTDIYSAGVVLYEMLTGRLPYEGDSPVAVAIKHINSTPVPPREINPNIPEGLEQITLKAMASKPGDRYESARAMLMDLDSFRKNPAIVFPYAAPQPAKAQPQRDEDETQILVAGGADLYGKPSRGRPPRRNAYTEAEEEPEEEFDEEEEEYRGGRRSREMSSRKKKQSKGIYIGIAAVVLIAFFAMIGIFIRGVLGSGTANQPEHTVPNLIDMQYEEAVLRYGTEFDIEVIGYKEDPNAKEGAILEQDPKADEVVKGSQPMIRVTVCKGANSSLLGYMPKLEGEKEDVAIRALTSMGVPEANIIKGTSVYSDTVPEGSVVSTEPGYGTSIASDTVITYHLSKGKDPNAAIKVPNLVDMTQNSASSELTAAGITKYEFVEEYSDTYAVGKVIRTDPAYGSSITANDKVIVYISKGPEMVTVTQFVGQNETVVMAQLKSMKLTGTFNRVEDSAAAGTILTQSVSSGSQVPAGTNIVFTVSSGPAESPSPSPSESPSDNPSGGGDSNVTVDKTITVDLPDQEGEVRVQVDLDGVTMYSNTVDCSRGSIDVPLSGSGTQDVEIYIDGKLNQSYSVNFS